MCETPYKILFIGCHPDDIELGCAGTLSRYILAGYEVHCIILTHGLTTGDACGDALVRPTETIAALTGLGVDRQKIHFGDFEDTKIEDNHTTVNFLETFADNRTLAAFVHSEHDAHQDHRNVALAARAAYRRIPNLLAYESPSAIGFMPHAYVDISSHIEAKWAALQCHRSQEEKMFMDYEAMIAVAAFRGRSIGVLRAESFEVIRHEITPLPIANSQTRPLVATRAVGELGGGSEAASNMRRLITLFRDEDRYVGRKAAEAVAALGAKLGVEAVLAEIIPLLQSSDASIRACAACVAAGLGAPAGTDSVLAELGSLMADKNGEVRHSAVVAIGRIGPKAAIDTVLKNLPQLLRDPDEVIQHDAAWAIGRLGQAAATEANLSGLLRLRDSGCGGDQWDSSVWTFRAMGLNSLSQPLLGQLAEMLRDDSILVQRYALRVLDTFSHSARSRGRSLAYPRRREQPNSGIPLETRIRWLENVVLTEEGRK